MISHNIINETQLRQLFSGCGFKHALIKKKNEADRHKEIKEKTLSDMLKALKVIGRMTRTEISEYLDISLPTCKKYLDMHIANGEIIKTSTGMKSCKHYYSHKEACDVIT